jgi:hypothetical protein
MSSIRYGRRADLSALADNFTMRVEKTYDGWRQRLVDALKREGRSQRSVSLAVGNGGLINSWLNEGKDPTIDNLMKVCREAGVSLPYVLYGFEIDAKVEELLLLLQGNPEKLDATLRLLREGTPPAP